MFALMTLFSLFFVGMCAVAVLAFAVFALKCTLKLALLPIKLALLPIKLLFLPIIAIALIVKFAVLLAVGAVLVAILIPIAILFLIFVGPFLLLGALS